MGPDAIVHSFRIQTSWEFLTSNYNGIIDIPPILPLRQKRSPLGFHCVLARRDLR